MSYRTMAEVAADKIENEISRRKRESKAKAELIGLLDSFNQYQRNRDLEESGRLWLESIDHVFYTGIATNRRFLRKVCFPHDRDIESPILGPSLKQLGNK